MQRAGPQSWRPWAFSNMASPGCRPGSHELDGWRFPCGSDFSRDKP
jgi:hypothetical protein